MSQSGDNVAKRVPKVSIGMPVYNAEKYLAGAIESFLKQGFDDFELVLSDNASTDKTAEIAERYAARDDRVRYFRQEENIGPAANFAFVLDAAQGTYFQWAAHDDLWRPYWLERAVAALERQSEVNFAFPSFAIKDQVLGFLETYDPKIFAFVEADDSRARLLHFLALHFSHKCNIVYSLFRKEFIVGATQIQGLENDGVLAAVCLGRSRGAIIGGFPFIKRWGIVRSRIRKLIPLSDRRKANFEADVARSLPVLQSTFPSIIPELEIILDAMRPGHFPKGYKVVDVEHLLAEKTVSS